MIYEYSCKTEKFFENSFPYFEVKLNERNKRSLLNADIFIYIIQNMYSL